MPMSKKDYVAIAKAINGALPVAAIKVLGPEGRARLLGLEQVAHDIANYCENDNPLFKRATFMRACGLK